MKSAQKMILRPKEIPEIINKLKNFKPSSVAEIATTLNFSLTCGNQDRLDEETKSNEGIMLALTNLEQWLSILNNSFLEIDRNRRLQPHQKIQITQALLHKAQRTFSDEQLWTDIMEWIHNTLILLHTLENTPDGVMIHKQSQQSSIGIIDYTNPNQLMALIVKNTKGDTSVFSPSARDETRRQLFQHIRSQWPDRAEDILDKLIANLEHFNFQQAMKHDRTRWKGVENPDPSLIIQTLFLKERICYLYQKNNYSIYEKCDNEDDDNPNTAKKRKSKWEWIHTMNRWINYEHLDLNDKIGDNGALSSALHSIAGIGQAFDLQDIFVQCEDTDEGDFEMFIMLLSRLSTINPHEFRELFCEIVGTHGRNTVYYHEYSIFEEKYQFKQFVPSVNYRSDFGNFLRKQFPNAWKKNKKIKKIITEKRQITPTDTTKIKQIGWETTWSEKPKWWDSIEF